MKGKKIAIICPANYPVPATKGGAIETLIEILVKENELYNNCDITVYSHYDYKAQIESIKYKNTKFVFIKTNKILDKINEFYIRGMRKLLKKEINISFIKSVIKDIKKNNISNIIIEGNKNYVLAIALGIKNSNVFLHIHSEPFLNNQHNKNEIIASKCKKIITVSDYIKNQTLKQVNVEKERIVTLKNCTNLDLFNKELYLQDRILLREKYKIKTDEVVIMFTGRILEIKGVKELILAFKEHCFRLDVKLLIVGNAGFGESSRSKYDDELIEISKEVQEKIIFTGFIHNNELPKIHSMVDIAIVPSMWDDPAPLVVIEAMSSGIPLIVTDSGGIPEYINKNCAIIVKRNENIINNIGEALVKLIKDEKLRNEMGINGRKQAQLYSTTNYYKNFIEILKDVGK